MSAFRLDSHSLATRENIMTVIDTDAIRTEELLDNVKAQAHKPGLLYAGGVTPPQAWALFHAGEAQLVDVRSNEERTFVGLVPGSHHVAWATGTSLTRNPRFVHELEAKFSKNTPLLLLCRSGKRSVLAAEAAVKAGFTQVFNVLEGFEGEIDTNKHRGGSDGWRFHGLPWEQN